MKKKITKSRGVPQRAAVDRWEPRKPRPSRLPQELDDDEPPVFDPDDPPTDFDDPDVCLWWAMNNPHS